MKFLNIPRHARRLILFCLIIATPVYAQAPKVVVSILPVHSLVAGVMQGVATPKLLLPATQSPHGLQLKPSQRRALAEAELIIWIGRDLETALDKPIKNSSAARVVELLSSNNLELLPVRDADAHDHGHGHGHGHEDEDAVDAHIWLSPDNAKAIVDIVAAELSAMDAAHSNTYKDNAKKLSKNIDAFHKKTRARLAALKEKNYVVFHDAYQYFEHEYGLAPAAALRVNAERPASAKRIRAIKKIIAKNNVRCAFSEPQFSDRWLNALQDDVATAVLDPLGVALQPGGDAWFELMDNLASSFANCLAE